MKNARDWLYYLRTSRPDSGWLAACEDELHSAIQVGLLEPPQFHDAVELLMEVFPFFGFIRMRLQHWSPHLREALVGALDLRDSVMQTRILTQLGNSYLLFGKGEASRQSFSIALERAREGKLEEMILAACVGLVGVQAVYLDWTFDLNMAHYVEALIPNVRDHRLRAEAHRMLALAYGFMGDTDLALGHAQTAYAYWHQLDSLQGMGDSAYRLSVLYYKLDRLDKAEEFQSLAQAHYARTEYARQYGLSAYNEGLLCMKREEFAEARECLDEALREFLPLGRLRDVTICYHARGLVETALGCYDAARHSLEKAVKGWLDLGDWYELASVYQALGYLDMLTNRLTQGEAHLHQALHLCERLPLVPKRQRLENHIQQTLAELSHKRN